MLRLGFFLFCFFYFHAIATLIYLASLWNCCVKTQTIQLLLDNQYPGAGRLMLLSLSEVT